VKRLCWRRCPEDRPSVHEVRQVFLDRRTVPMVDVYLCVECRQQAHLENQAGLARQCSGLGLTELYDIWETA